MVRDMATSKKQDRKQTDWQQLKNRLAATRFAPESGQALSPERVQAILEQRARAIARVPEPLPAAGSLLAIVSFRLGEEHYALETRHVREVLRYKTPTRLRSEERRVGKEWRMQRT